VKENRKLYSLDISMSDLWDAEQQLDTLYDDLKRIFIEKNNKLIYE
jgi:hypothetical protein